MNRMLSLLLGIVLLAGWSAGHAQTGVDGPKAAARNRDFVNSIGMNLARIPGGEFLMGSAPSDPGARGDEQPQHRVRITKPFYMGVYEVTQAEFEKLMQTNPSSFTR